MKHIRYNRCTRGPLALKHGSCCVIRPPAPVHRPTAQVIHRHERGRDGGVRSHTTCHGMSAAAAFAAAECGRLSRHAVDNAPVTQRARTIHTCSTGAMRVSSFSQAVLTSASFPNLLLLNPPPPPSPPSQTHTGPFLSYNFRLAHGPLAVMTPLLCDPRLSIGALSLGRGNELPAVQFVAVESDLGRGGTTSLSTCVIFSTSVHDMHRSCPQHQLSWPFYCHQIYSQCQIREIIVESLNKRLRDG